MTTSKPPQNTATFPCNLSQLQDGAVCQKQIFLDPVYQARYVAWLLDETNSKAARRVWIREQHVAWLNEVIFDKRPSRYVDIGCGVGHYTQALSHYGHAGLGIDILSPAIEYAQKQYGDQNTDFLCADFLTVSLPTQLDCVLMIYSVFNTLSREAARQLLQKLFDSLAPHGVLYFEPLGFIDARYYPKTFWEYSEESVFCSEPHLSLVESCWHSNQTELTVYNYILQQNGHADAFYEVFQLYRPEEYVDMLKAVGFSSVEILPTPPFLNHEEDRGYLSIKATR